MCGMKDRVDVLDAQFHLGPGGIEKISAAMDALGIASALLDEYWVKDLNGMPFIDLENGMQRPVCPTAELAALCEPGRFGYVRRVKKDDPWALSLIHLAADDPGCKAIRLDAGLNPFDMQALQEGGFDFILEAAGECDLPVFIYAPDSPSVYSGLARKFPDLPIVIDHCGIRDNMVRPYFKADVLSMEEQVRLFEDVLRLSEYPNLWMKWSHVSENFEKPAFPGAGLKAYLRKAISAFGVERILWASDYSTIQTGECWAEHLFGMLGNDDLDSNELRMIMGGNARRLLRWPAPQVG